MTPYGFTVKGDIETFHYHYSELKKWLTIGKSEGTVGVLLVKRNSKTKDIIFKGFGTLEHPNTSRYTLQMKHFALFDGRWREPTEIIKPPLFQDSPFMSHKLIFIDTSDYNGEANVQSRDNSSKFE